MGSVFLGGCALEEERTDADEIEVAESDLEVGNALNLNALNLNALNLNALNLNALNLNGMDPSAVAAIQHPDGVLAREIVKYGVSCAFTSSQSFSFSWTDKNGVQHQETYPGLLGLAPGWSSGALEDEDRRWVSACLASRVNWYGVPVMISSRSSHDSLKNPSSSEMVNYPKMEGAFWGDLFDETPHVHACYIGLNMTNSWKHKRDCAAGHPDGQGGLVPCGLIQIVGSCATRCGGLASEGYYSHCQVDPQNDSTSATEVITTFLPP